MCWKKIDRISLMSKHAVNDQHTVGADFEVKNHQYALTKNKKVQDWTGLILYIWGHLNTLSFSRISVSKHHSHVYLCAASRGSIDPNLRPSETESQCKCGQNTSPASPHTNKSLSAVKRSTFSSGFLYLDQRNPTPKTFTGNLAFSASMPKLSVLWWQ